MYNIFIVNNKYLEVNKIMKITKKTLSQEIILISGLVTSSLEEIKEIKNTCENYLIGEYKKLSAELIKKYEIEITKIESQNYQAYKNRGWEYFDRTFNKPVIKGFVERLERDLTILYNISKTLLGVIDDAHKNNNLLDKNDLSDDEIIEAIENPENIETPKKPHYEKCVNCKLECLGTETKFDPYHDVTVCKIKNIELSSYYVGD
jgi:hypothetical protein